MLHYSALLFSLTAGWLARAWIEKQRRRRHHRAPPARPLPATRSLPADPYARSGRVGYENDSCCWCLHPPPASPDLCPPSHLSWDDYFMAVAFLSAQRSKDPSKQVCVCLGGGGLVGEAELRVAELSD